MNGRVFSVLLLLGVTVNWGGAVWIFAKAELAQFLIARAWAETLETQRTQRPWPWADTWPVARLRHADRDLFVLAGAHGSALAFGPGHHDASDPPGYGHSVIGGHRDTHFAFLETVRSGDEFSLQKIDREWQRYSVTDQRVVDSRTDAIGLITGANRLELVTCYPFDAIVPGGPLRFRVIAEQLRSKKNSYREHAL
ncbi:MAG: class GN sortase [Pseudomonadota bacterium]